MPANASLCDMCHHKQGSFCAKFNHPAHPDLMISAAFALTERCFGKKFTASEHAVFLATVREKGQSLTESKK